MINSFIEVPIPISILNYLIPPVSIVFALILDSIAVIPYSIYQILVHNANYWLVTDSISFS